VPSNGCCTVPFTLFGNGSPAASSTVGAMSVAYVNCDRNLPRALIRLGQRMTMPFVVPP
jgi:hypothetical protein